jgi:hypothetical protein
VTPVVTAPPTQPARPAPVVLPAPVSFPNTGGAAESDGTGILWLVLAFAVGGVTISAGARILCAGEAKIDD